MTIFNEMLATKEEHVVARADLALDPKMQMRTEMCHETIKEYAEGIKDWIHESPIEVVVVEHANGEETFYVVDGFHRTHAAQIADLEGVDAIVYRADYETAVKYAMSRNFKHGKKATAEDTKKAIKRLMEFAPDFGYDSKGVNKYIEGYIKSSHIRKFTPTYIEAIKKKRDAKILELHGEGKSQREISEEVGCAKGTIQNVLDDGQKSSPNKNVHQEPHLTFLDEDEETCSGPNPAELSETKRLEREQKALDKAEAMNRELAAEQNDTTNPPDVLTNENEEEYVSPLEKALCTLEMHADFLSDEHIARLKALLAHA